MTASNEMKLDDTDKEQCNGINDRTERLDTSRQEQVEEDTHISEAKEGLLSNHHESQEDDDTNFIDSAIEMDVMTPESEVMIQIQKSQSDEWFPDGGFGWAVVIGGVIIHIFIGGFMKSSGVMYIKLRDKFNQSAVATAWVFSLFTTFLLMMGPIASALCHRFTCRTVVFWGSVLCFIGILLSAYAPNLQFLYFSYCVVGGFGRCLTYTPSLIIISTYFNKRRGLAVGLATAGVGLGMFTFPPLLV